MPRRNWKRVQPRDLRDAMDLCLEYARDKRNLSVDSISEQMGVASKWTLYKWLQEASLPLRLVKTFEMACGIDLISRHLAASGNKLVIDIPTGKQSDADDLFKVQEVTNHAVGALLKFYAQRADVSETLSAVQTALESLAWHRGNVEKYSQPEIPFGEGQ